VARKIPPEKTPSPGPKLSLDQMLAGSIAREASAQRPPAARAPQPRAREDQDRDARLIERERIEPNPAQPRRLFPKDDLRVLGQSLRRDGQLQALVVRAHPSKSGHFQIVSGERRWRAAAPEFGDIDKLRATVRELSDEETLRLALIENIQRTDLSAIEIARGLDALRSSTRVDETPISRRPSPSTRVDKGADSGALSGSTPSSRVDSNEVLGRLVGFTRARVQQLLALLDLPPEAQKKIEAARLNEKHGRALLMLKGQPRAQQKLLREIERDNLSGNQALRRAEAQRAPRAQPRPQVLEPPAQATQAASEAPAEASTEASTEAAWDVLNEHLLPAVRLAERAARALGASSTQVDEQGGEQRLREAAQRLYEAACAIRDLVGGKPSPPAATPAAPRQR